MENKIENNLIICNFAQIDLPKFSETRYDDFIRFGEDNLFPNFLIELSNRSDIHNAIISSKVDYICGNGFTYDKRTDTKTDKFLESVNRFEDFATFFRKIVYDYVIFGGFAINVVKTKGGIDELWHIDFSRIRSGKMNEFEKVDNYYYSKNWCDYKIKAFNPSQIKAYTINGKENSSLIYYKDYRPGQDYYPLPSYIGSLSSIATNAEISNYHLSAIRNGMSPSFLINFPNGLPTSEERKKIERQVNEKFTGSDSAGKIMITFSEDKDRAPEISTIQPSDIDKQFIQLEASTQQAILTGHKVNNPLIVGIPTPGKLGGSNEFKDSFNIYDSTIITPMRNVILGVINKWGAQNKLQEIKVIPSQPIENTFSESYLEKILTINESREEIGKDPINIDQLVNGTVIPAEIEIVGVTASSINFEKVSFDYDDTLTKESIRNKAKNLIKNGDEVYIVTARKDKDMEVVYNIGKELGINKDHIFNTNGKDKWETLKRLGIDKHYDNNKEQIDKINSNTNTNGILV